MNPEQAPQIVWSAALLIFVVVLVSTVFRRRRRGHGGPGAGAMGAVYDLLNEDKRNAIEIIAEEKAAATDPEDAEGNLPDLAAPRGTRRT